MSLSVRCPQCGARLTAPDEYAGLETKCVACDIAVPLPMRVPRKRFSFSLSRLVIVAPIVVVAVGMLGYGLRSALQSANKAIQNGVISHAEYMQIQDGMSYAQVVAIVGQPGTETASSHIAEIPGFLPRITMKAYCWENLGGSNMILMFRNDALISKAQFGLK